MLKRVTLILASSLVLLGLFTIAACIDDEDDLISQNCNGACATVTGVLTTHDGTQSLAGVELTAKWVNTVYLGGGTIRTKAKTRTDNSGNYTLQFEVRSDELQSGYFLFEVLTDEEYFRCVPKEYPSFSMFGLRNDTTITHNLHIPFVAHLNVASTGAEKMATTDYFSVNITPHIKQNSTACGSVQGWTNKNPNTIYNINVPAETKLIIETVINKGQSYERSYDTLVIEKGKTKSFKAVYP